MFIQIAWYKYITFQRKLLDKHPVATKPASTTSGEPTHNLAAGDMVEVCEGELIHLQGKIIRIDGNKVTMLPKHEDLKVNALHVHGTLSNTNHIILIFSLA